jgi:hypothetical protein
MSLAGLQADPPVMAYMLSTQIAKIKRKIRKSPGYTPSSTDILHKDWPAVQSLEVAYPLS